MKTIHLNKGDVLVDDENYEPLKPYKLFIKPDDDGYPTVRAVVYPETGRTTILLCELMYGILPDDRAWDHFDGNMLNNQRSNLQVIPLERWKKRRIPLSKKAHPTWRGIYMGYAGVFLAYIAIKEKRIFLGQYDNVVSAGIAYNHGALKYHKEKAKFNDIPGWQDIIPQVRPQKNASPNKYIYQTRSGKFQVQIKRKDLPNYCEVFSTLELAITARDLYLKNS